MIDTECINSQLDKVEYNFHSFEAEKLYKVHLA